MGRLNGVAHRIAVHERRWPAPVPEPEPEPEFTNALASFWERVRAVAPEPVWQYILEVDAELAAAMMSLPQFDADALLPSDHDPKVAWLKRHHPAFDDVLEGLARATSSGAHNRLAYTQGWVVQWASARLGMAYALERPGAGVSTSTVIDRVVQERAAADLLRWSVAEVHRQWADPCAFLERWRSNSPYVGRLSDRSDILGKAALFDAELALLDAEEER